MMADIMLIDVIKFENFGEIKIGDMLSYKNKMFININFISIFKNVQLFNKYIFGGMGTQIPNPDGGSSETDEDD